MKIIPFDIEKVKNGAIPVTRQGAFAKILNIDEENKEIMALIGGGHDHLYDFSGCIKKWDREEIPFNIFDRYNLCILESPNEYWINVCQNENGVYVSNEIFYTKKAAIQFAPRNAINTICIYRFFERKKTVYSFAYKRESQILVFESTFEEKDNANASGVSFCKENGLEFIGVVNIDTELPIME